MDLGSPTGSTRGDRFQACWIRVASGMHAAVTRPPASNRGLVLWLSAQGLSDATSNTGAGSGGRLSTAPG